MRVLITGGAGFVGANLTRVLLAEGYSIRVLDDLSAASDRYIRGLEVDLRKASLEDTAAVGRAVRGVDTVVHLAAMSGVSPSVRWPKRDFSTNVAGTFTVLDACRRARVERVIFASSGAVLAGCKPPLHEDLRPHVLAPYGASKLYGEAIVQSFSNSYGVIGVSLRFSNLYGPFMTHKKSVIPSFLKSALRGQPFPVNGSGRQTRDFLHVADVAKAVQAVMSGTRGGLFQLGTGRPTNILQLARLIARVTGVPLQIERRPKGRADAHRNFADINLARRILAWKPEVPLEAGLRDTFMWMREGASDLVPAVA